MLTNGMDSRCHDCEEDLTMSEIIRYGRQNIDWSATQLEIISSASCLLYLGDASSRALGELRLQPYGISGCTKLENFLAQIHYSSR